MKNLFCIFLISLSFGATAQKILEGPCAPQINSCTTCDSLKKAFHEDALYATYISVQDTSSHFFDSLYLPQELIIQYENAFMALYNWFPDSISSLRNSLYIYSRYEMNKRGFKMPWKEFTIIPLPAKSTKSKKQKNDTSDFRTIFRPDSESLNQLGQINAICSKPINPSAIARKIKGTGWTIPESWISYKLFQSWGPPVLQLSMDKDGIVFTFAFSYTSCMPPEWPCKYVTRKFLVRKDCSVEYLSCIYEK